MLNKFLDYLGSAKKQKIFFSVVLVISVLVIIFTTVFLQKQEQKEDDLIYVNANVNSVSTYVLTDEHGNTTEHYNVVVSFSFDDVRYNDIIISDTDNVAIGSDVTISFKEGNPTECQIEPAEALNIGLILFYIFFAFLAIGSLAIIMFITKHDKIENHKKIRAEIAEQHRKDEEATNIAKREYYETEPNPFDHDLRDYSDDFNDFSVTDSFCDADAAYSDYGGQENSDGFYGSYDSVNPSDTSSELQQNPFSYHDTYTNPYAPAPDTPPVPFPTGNTDTYANPYTSAPNIPPVPFPTGNTDSYANPYASHTQNQ